MTSAQMTPFDPANPFSCLPNEVISQVLCYFDSYSIQALIKVFPWLVNLCVLVTDHNAVEPLFFNIDGLQRTQLCYSQDLTDFPVYSPQLNKKPIRFVEFYYEKSLSFLSAIDTLGGTINRQAIALNSSTFIFLDSRQIDFSTTNYARLLDQHGGKCKFYNGYPHSFSADALRLTAGQYSFRKSSSDLITNLSIHGVDTFKNHRMPKSLKSLSISLNRAHYNEQREYVYPEVSHLTFKSLPEIFRIQYTKDLPHVYDITYKRRYSKVLDIDLDPVDPFDFEIVDTLSVNKRSLPHIPKLRRYDEDLKYVRLELEFTEHCKRFSLRGVPYHFVSHCLFTNARHVTWEVSSTSGLEYSSGVDLAEKSFPCVTSFNISIDEPGVILPALKIQRIYHIPERLQSLVINIFAPDVDVGGLVHNVQTSECFMSIYRSLSLLKNYKEDPPWLIPHRYWTSFWLSKNLLDTRCLEMVGFQMPFLYIPLRPVIQHRGAVSGIRCRSWSFKLQPVVTMEEYNTHFKESNQMVLNGLISDVRDVGLSGEISPIMHFDQGALLKPMALILDLGVQLVGDENESSLRVVATSHFDKFYYRDQELSTAITDEWWKRLINKHDRLRRLSADDVKLVKHQWKTQWNRVVMRYSPLVKFSSTGNRVWE